MINSDCLLIKFIIFINYRTVIANKELNFQNICVSFSEIGVHHQQQGDAYFQ